MAKDKTTTIKLERKTKERLDGLKEYEKESYDFLINKTLNILNICRRNPALSCRILRDIENSRKREKLIESPERVIRKKKPQMLAEQFNVLQSQPRTLR